MIVFGKVLRIFKLKDWVQHLTFLIIFVWVTKFQGSSCFTFVEDIYCLHSFTLSFRTIFQTLSLIFVMGSLIFFTMIKEKAETTDHIMNKIKQQFSLIPFFKYTENKNLLKKQISAERYLISVSAKWCRKGKQQFSNELKHFTFRYSPTDKRQKMSLTYFITAQKGFILKEKIIKMMQDRMNVLQRIMNSQGEDDEFVSF